MGLSKNTGPPLKSTGRGSVDNFPREFLAKIGIQTISQQVPVDVEPKDLTLLLVESKLTQERTDERKLSDTYLLEPPNENPLFSEVKLESGLVGTRTRQLVIDPTDLDPLVGCLTESADQVNLGNGWLDQTVVQAPSLFTRAAFRRTRPDVTPTDFGALLETDEVSVTACGPASDPVLDDLDLSATDEQLDVWKHRTSRATLDNLPLPQFITNYKTNQYKQTVISARELRLDNNTPYVPTALSESKYTVLGDGTALAEVDTVQELFLNLVYEKSIPDLLPDIFKAALPLFTVETNSTGIADPDPTLVKGQLSRREEQYDVFNRRVRIIGRSALLYPQDITVLRHLGGFEFGGEHTKVTGYLDDSEPVVEDGLGIVSSEVRNLGNLTWFRQTEKWDTATEWPQLVGTEVDPRTGIVVEVRRKVVAAGTTGGVSGSEYTDVKPIDKWKSIQIVSALDLDSLPSVRTWETTVEHRFDNTLNSAFFLWAAAIAPHAYDFDSALLLDVTQGYAGPCRALVTESFSDGPPVGAVAVTQFFPQGYTIGYAWSLADDVTADEDCGECFGIARATARTWPVPPTLHPEITIGGGVIITGGGISNTLPATNPTGLPGSGTLITKSVDVEPWRFNIFYRRMVQIYVP